MQNTNVPQGWNFSEFGTFAFLAKDKYEPDANEHKRCIELEHIEKETGKLISVSDSSTHTSVKNKFAINDVLFGKLRPYLKKYYKPAFEGVCSTEIWVLRGKQEILQEYLFLLIQSDKFISACNVSTGSRMPRADWSFVSETPFLLPPINEQKKIAEILETWDRAIEELTGLIAEKKELKRGLMQKLLTGEIRISGFAKTWKKVKLCEIGTTYTGLSGKDKDDFGKGSYFIPYMNVYQNSKIDSKQLELVDVSDNESQNVVQYGDIFFTTSSETPEEVGFASVLLFRPEEKIYLNSFCFGYRLNNFDALLPNYASFLFRSKQIRKITYKLAQGATRFNLSKNELMKEKVCIPADVLEQQAIADILSTIDSEIDLLNQRLDILKEQKRGLMQKLLTGEIRVKVDKETC